MNQFDNSDYAYQQTFAILISTFLAFSLLGLFLEVPNVELLTQQIFELAKSFLRYFQGRSFPFYLIFGGAILFSFPSCFVVLLALRYGRKSMKASIDEESAYWNSNQSIVNK
ncbi:MAG: hypothetical protein AAF490_02810 [Chloroflexota bacterium]